MITFLGLRRGELIALRKEDLDVAAGTLTVARSRDADTTKGGRAVTLPIPAALEPFLEAAVRASPSEWLFPKPDGSRRDLELDVTAVLRRALGRAGIVEGYEHRCHKARCGYVARAADSAQRRCPEDGHALWLRPLPRRLSFHSLRHTCATVLAKGARPPQGCAADPSSRRRRDDARHLHPRRSGRPARGTFAHLCCQFAANGLDPKS